MRHVKHPRNIKTEIQFPASFAASPREMTGSSADFRANAARAIRLPTGAPTDTIPAAPAAGPDLISAPMTLNTSAPLMVFSSDPITPSLAQAASATSSRETESACDKGAVSSSTSKEMAKKSSITSPCQQRARGKCLFRRTISRSSAARSKPACAANAYNSQVITLKKALESCPQGTDVLRKDSPGLHQEPVYHEPFSA